MALFWFDHLVTAYQAGYDYHPRNGSILEDGNAAAAAVPGFHWPAKLWQDRILPSNLHEDFPSKVHLWDSLGRYLFCSVQVFIFSPTWQANLGFLTSRASTWLLPWPTQLKGAVLCWKDILLVRWKHGRQLGALVVFFKSENSNMFTPSLSYCLKAETSCNTQQTPDLSKQSQQTAQGPSRSSLPAGRFDGWFWPTILGTTFHRRVFLAWGSPHLVAQRIDLQCSILYYIYIIYAYPIHSYTYLYTSNLLQSPNIPSSFVGGLPSGVSLPLEVCPCRPSLPGRRCVARGRDRAWHLSC